MECQPWVYIQKLRRIATHISQIGHHTDALGGEGLGKYAFWLLNATWYRTTLSLLIHSWHCMKWHSSNNAICRHNGVFLKNRKVTLLVLWRDLVRAVVSFALTCDARSIWIHSDARKIWWCPLAGNWNQRTLNNLEAEPMVQVFHVLHFVRQLIGGAQIPEEWSAASKVRIVKWRGLHGLAYFCRLVAVMHEDSMPTVAVRHNLLLACNSLRRLPR